MNSIEEKLKHIKIPTVEDVINRRVLTGSIYSGGPLILDNVPAEDGDLRTQSEWIEYYNKKEKAKGGKRFPSMAELYQVFRQIAEAPEEHEALLASLRQDFNARWLLSSTRINYNPNDEHAKIIHNYGSGMQKEPIEIEIPVLCPGKSISTELDGRGIEFLQALLGTDDGKEGMMGVLGKISNMPNGKLKIWTPPLTGDSGHTTRSKRPGRAVSLNCSGGEFLVDAGSIPDYGDGRSRAMAVSVASF